MIVKHCDSFSVRSYNCENILLIIVVNLCLFYFHYRVSHLLRGCTIRIELLRYEKYLVNLNIILIFFVITIKVKVQKVQMCLAFFSQVEFHWPSL